MVTISILCVFLAHALALRPLLYTYIRTPCPLHCCRSDCHDCRIIRVIRNACCSCRTTHRAPFLPRPFRATSLTHFWQPSAAHYVTPSAVNALPVLCLLLHLLLLLSSMFAACNRLPIAARHAVKVCGRRRRRYGGSRAPRQPFSKPALQRLSREAADGDAGCWCRVQQSQGAELELPELVMLNRLPRVHGHNLASLWCDDQAAFLISPRNTAGRWRHKLFSYLSRALLPVHSHCCCKVWLHHSLQALSSLR